MAGSTMDPGVPRASVLADVYVMQLLSALLVPVVRAMVLLGPAPTLCKEHGSLNVTFLDTGPELIDVADSDGITAELGDPRLGEWTSGGGSRELRLLMMAGVPWEGMETAVLESVENDVAMLWERVERFRPGGRATERGGRWVDVVGADV